MFKLAELNLIAQIVRTSIHTGDFTEYVLENTQENRELAAKISCRWDEGNEERYQEHIDTLTIASEQIIIPSSMTIDYLTSRIEEESEQVKASAGY